MRMKSPNEITNSDLVAIGSIGKSHGLNGSFFLNSYCDPEENFFTYERFFLIQKNKILELSIKSKQIKSSKNIINISNYQKLNNQINFGFHYTPHSNPYHEYNEMLDWHAIMDLSCD